MRILPAILLVGLVTSTVAQVSPASMSPEVKGVLTPILETWRKLETDPKCVALGDRQKDYPGYCSQLQNQLDSQVVALSHNKGATADEAVAALFSFGIQKDEGDQGHDFICMAAARGSAMTKALRKYRACELDMSAEYPKSMRSEITTCRRAIDRAIDVIRTDSADKICAWD
jgi:hypothetical protein